MRPVCPPSALSLSVGKDFKRDDAIRSFCLDIVRDCSEVEILQKHKASRSFCILTFLLYIFILLFLLLLE
jgi:hypothetical protein